MVTKLTGANVLTGASRLRKGLLGSAGTYTRAQRKLIMGDPLLRKAMYNKNMTVSAGMAKAALHRLQDARTETGEVQTEFSTLKSADAVTRALVKEQVEAQAQAKSDNAATSSGKSAWEQKLEEKKEEAERNILETRTEAHEEAAARQRVAKTGAAYAKAETIQQMKEEEREQERGRVGASTSGRRYAVTPEEKKRQLQQKKAAMEKLASTDPRQLAKFANSIF